MKVSPSHSSSIVRERRSRVIPCFYVHHKCSNVIFAYKIINYVLHVQEKLHIFPFQSEGMQVLIDVLIWYTNIVKKCHA